MPDQDEYDESLIVDEENDEGNFYSWTRCGHVGSKDDRLPERVQYKGQAWGASDFDLAWYIREDLKDRERSLILQMLALVLLDKGVNIGWKADPHNPDWTILVMDLPQGQISHHIPLSFKIANLPDFHGNWFWAVDYEQCDRMQTFIASYSTSFSTR